MGDDEFQELLQAECRFSRAQQTSAHFRNHDSTQRPSPVGELPAQETWKIPKRPAIPRALQERVIGCFRALATGDAIGKQTELLSRADVQPWYPGLLRDRTASLEKSSLGMLVKRHEWRIPSIGGAIAEPLYPETVNQEWFEVADSINENDLLELAHRSQVFDQRSP